MRHCYKIKSLMMHGCFFFITRVVLIVFSVLLQILDYQGFVRHICSRELWSGYQQCQRSEIRCRQEAWGIDGLLSASLQALHSGNHRDMPPLISTDQSSDNMSSPQCLQTCLKCLHSGLYNKGYTTFGYTTGLYNKGYTTKV